MLRVSEPWERDQVQKRADGQSPLLIEADQAALALAAAGTAAAC